jgi:peroxiredoxin
VLLDLGNGVARDYGVAFELGDELSNLYLNSMDIDLTRYNGDESWTLPIPATFVLDPAGTIVWTSAHPDYTVRPEPSEVLAAIP